MTLCRFPEGWENSTENMALLRVISSLAAEEITSNRKIDPRQLRPDGWHMSTILTDEGLALDSLERMNCGAALNEFFLLYEYGAEDYLMTAETLADWVRVVAVSRQNWSKQLTFRTSGSTGTPKRCVHDVKRLKEETKFWAEVFAGRSHIVSFVPAHHIFGYLFTTLLPAQLSIPLIDLRFSGVGAAKQAMSHGAPLVIATPAHWQFLSRSFLKFPEGVVGVSSTAPISQQLVSQLDVQGLDQLVQVYGSSETAGVGYRTDAAVPYRLLPGLKIENGGDYQCIVRHSGGGRAELMDNLTVIDDETFWVNGRKDNAVQVGGHNVFPAQVRKSLLQHPSVSDCQVYLCPERARLIATIVPGNEAGGNFEALEEDLRDFCVLQFSAAERPVAFEFAREIDTAARQTA